MKKMFKTIITTLLFLTVLPIFAQQSVVKVDLLQNVRGNIVFPEMTNAEKRVVAEQAQILLKDLYVHRLQKMDYYGSSVDPVPAIAEVVANVDNMTTAEMEVAIYKIFVAQRDLHLNFVFPEPHAKYTSFIPIRFTRVAGENNFFEVRVAGANAGEINALAPGQRVPDIGDELITYDGLPVLEAVEKLKETAQGANRYAGFTRALSRMTYVNHMVHLVPENNEVTMTFRSHVSGELYTATYPWAVEWKETVAAEARADEQVEEEEFDVNELYQATNYEHVEYMDYLARTQLKPRNTFPATQSLEPTVYWGLIENGQGKFGYLSITSFSPKKGVTFALEEIIRIITGKFVGTKGLIIDVRGNGGGNILYADRLSQLFMAGTARTIEARLLNSPVNSYIFNVSPFQYMENPIWKEVMNAAAPTDIYTPTAAFTRTIDANVMGQVYYKPVIVLNNSESYSATDLFSCAMQDNGAALIFGEDPQTGAGGANVMKHSFFAQYIKGPFVDLPKGQAMRVSWRQSVRFGKSAGKLIEDYGCQADYDASRTITDLIDGGQGQIALLTQYLNNLSGLERAYVVPEINEKLIYAAKDRLQFNYKVGNTDKVKVLVNGLPFQEINVNSNFGEKDIRVDLGSNWPLTAMLNVAVEGYDHAGGLLWNTKKNVIVLEAEVVVGAVPVVIDFAQATSVAPLTVFNYSNAPADGWRLDSPYLQLGNNPTYKNNVYSDAVLLMNLSQKDKVSLSFTLDYDLVNDGDYLEVYLKVGSLGATLLKVSGKGAMKTYTYNLGLAGLVGTERMRLGFRVKSGNTGTAAGVKVSNIVLQ